MVDYIMKHGSVNLKLALLKLITLKKGYEVEIRKTVVDLLNIGTKLSEVWEFEELHDNYYLEVSNDTI